MICKYQGDLILCESTDAIDSMLRQMDRISNRRKTFPLFIQRNCFHHRITIECERVGLPIRYFVVLCIHAHSK